MQLLDHLSITVADFEKAVPFYKAVMASLGAGLAYEETDAIGFGERNSPDEIQHTYLSVFSSAAASSDPKRHYCFKAESHAQVRAFHVAALKNGDSDAGQPGLRDYHRTYYAAFVLDPAGNKLEAVCHKSDES